MAFGFDEYKNKVDLLNFIYPVGSIYMSVGTTSPAVLFGGTWEQIEGKFLLASSSSHALGTTGGEETHTLNTNEMPSHTHKFGIYGYELAAGSVVGAGVTDNPSHIQGYMNSESTGGGQAHNNMPPFLTVNVWKRTA